MSKTSDNKPKMRLTEIAKYILDLRHYLMKKGDRRETPEEMMRRVAHAIAAQDEEFKSASEVSRLEEEFYEMLASLDFLPNTPTLTNAGKQKGQLAACFVLPVEDSLDGIFSAMRNMAVIQQTGGGTGFSFSKLRPNGDFIGTTQAKSTGPLSFMSIFNKTTDIVKQQGIRRGANMGVLRVDHPDILEFVDAKKGEREFQNFNLSVGITKAFMDSMEKGEEYSLINPRTKKEVGRLNARDVYDRIIHAAWETGDPGVIFLDRINETQPTPNVGEIEATNPCGEQPLLPNEACNLGSINLSHMIVDGKLDEKKLRRITETETHFLDNVISANYYPIPDIESVVKANRKIGLGVMGYADALLLMGIRYDSDEALQFAEKVMKIIIEGASGISRALAAERGSFLNFPGSRIALRGDPPQRNATLITIAPTGTISLIAGCSSGIEPLFAISYERPIIGGKSVRIDNAIFVEMAKKGGWYSDSLMNQIAIHGSLDGVSAVPEKIKDLFRTAFQISAEWHVKVQALFQKYCDNAVSKTVNIPEEASLDEVRRAYDLAYRLGCKGVTAFRTGCKSCGQVLTIAPRERT